MEEQKVILLHFVLSALCCVILLVEIIKLWDRSNSDTTPWHILVTLGILFAVIAIGINDHSIALGMWFGTVGCGVAVIRCKYYLSNFGSPPDARCIDSGTGCPTSGTQFDQKKWQQKNILSPPMKRLRTPRKHTKTTSNVTSLEEFKNKKN